MCLICLELEKLTFPEAVNNLVEMREKIGDEHAAEVGLQLAINLWENIEEIEAHIKEHGNEDLFLKRAEQLFDLMEDIDIDLGIEPSMFV